MGPKKDISAPRVYNLFPRIVGTVDQWYKHLDRIVAMGFNWIYLNPLNYPGFSGSLYAVKDFYKFNPIFTPPGTTDDEFSWDPLKEFISACHKKKIKFMYDLVINHTAIDSDLVKDHKDWYVIKCVVAEKSSGRVIMQCPRDEPPNKRHFREPAFIIEERIAHPMAIDPADARKVTIWGDLAEIDNHASTDKDNLLQYWKDLVSFYLDMGIDGFRCDAAYKVPPETWKPLIEHARVQKPSTMFVAETLGCRIEELERTVMSGFDYIYNSSKYWDFTQPWLLEQYEQFRKHAPSIGFPESHDTHRLAAETGKREDVQKFRYLFSAFFSAGVMMPVGYEFGFQRQLNVVETRPTHWEQNIFDISTFITKVNEFKKK
nr:alpha-amylase family glycosyl hydrolase [Candidatus Sigynarchaeota archaeon]